MPINRHLFLLVFIFCSAISCSIAQNRTARIACYKIDNYQTLNFERRVALHSVISYMAPNIVIIQGIADIDLIDSLLQNGVIDYMRYGSSASIEQKETGIGIGIFWDSVVDVPRLGITTDSTRTGRLFEQVSFVAPGIPDTLHIFICDFTEGGDSASISKRTIEAEDIVDFIHAQVRPEKNEAIVVGALNARSSSDIEPLFTANAGARMADPMNATGTWHGNLAFSNILTYPTRVSGADSGLNDRFDMILVPPTSRYYQADSYVVFGNDGMHFRDSVNHQPNTVVPRTISVALQRASLHLPVYANFVFGASSGVEKEQEIKKMWLSWLP